MAYVATDPSRLGQKNATGTTNDLFLKVFSGEIITVFDEVNVMLPTTTVRTITTGKSAQFPAVGVANATYHVPGQDILADDAATPEYLSSVKHNEIIIVINDLLVSSVFIDSLDEAKNHYDVRGEYTKQMTGALSAKADRTLIHHGIQGAREAADRFGGTDYIGKSIDIGAASAAAVTSAQLIKEIFAAAEYMDSKDVPSDDRYVVLSPTEYYKLIASADGSAGGLVLNRDFGNEGNGSIAGGTIMSVAGFKVLKSNHMPTANLDVSATHSGDQSTLADATLTGDGNIPIALCYQKGGLGTVKLRDLRVEAERRIERQGHLIVASYAMGHEVLRTECLVELKT